MNEITKKPDKATSFQPTFNTKLEKDKNQLEWVILFVITYQNDLSGEK